jgi:hypothetical protein
LKLTVSEKFLVLALVFKFEVLWEYGLFIDLLSIGARALLANYSLEIFMGSISGTANKGN